MLVDITLMLSQTIALAKDVGYLIISAPGTRQHRCAVLQYSKFPLTALNYTAAQQFFLFSHSAKSLLSAFSPPKKQPLSNLKTRHMMAIGI